MIRTSYLRVYQPLSAFPPHEREQWLRRSTDQEPADVRASQRWLIRAALPEASSITTEGAFFREGEDELLVCPWRTRLRMLSGLVAFRDSIPDEVADAFVPRFEATQAAHELESLGESRPDLRSHIVHANWHVPLRWFTAFDDVERILVEDRNGLRIRYETNLGNARTRLERACSVLEGNWIDDGVIEAVKELLVWLSGFGSEGLLELDYSSVAGMFSDESLLEDRSAAEVTACIDALEGADPLRAGKLFGVLSNRWTEARAMEVVN